MLMAGFLARNFVGVGIHTQAPRHPLPGPWHGMARACPAGLGMPLAWPTLARRLAWSVLGKKHANMACGRVSMIHPHNAPQHASP